MLDSVFNDLSIPSTGEKAKARNCIEAIRTLKELNGPATDAQKARLRRFPGFGCLALLIIPDPTTGRYRDGWEDLGQELEGLLTPDEYASARRTVFNAFYTSPLVMRAIYTGLERMGLPATANVLEPGCGVGGFMSVAPEGMRFTGIEMDDLSGRIAQALYPQHDIRIENYRDTKIGSVDCAVGNVPFADISMDYGPHRFSLHDYFFAKSVDALAPGGLLAFVTSRFTLDKITGKAREYLAETADFVGAIRLPDDAFKDQGTRVVTDIVFLRKRHPGEEPKHAGNWLTLSNIPGTDTAVNTWFVDQPDMVLGEFSVGRGMYGQDTLKVAALNDFEQRLWQAINTLPVGVFSAKHSQTRAVPSGLEEGSFFIEGGAVLQVEAGQLVPVKYGERIINTNDGMMGKRLAALVTLRDLAKHVLKTQNEGKAIEDRELARYSLNQAYSRFVKAYGPINKTTFSRNALGNEVRRVPNVARFREDPNAFLVMSLEEYDESTGVAERSPIMLRDVVGPTEPVLSVETAEQGLAVCLNERGRVDLDYIKALYGKDPTEELGDLIFKDPDDGCVTKETYLSGNVRRKLERATDPRNIAALEAVQPEDILPGDIDANLGAPWLPTDIIEAFAADLLCVQPDSITVAHLPKDAVWSVDGDASAKASVQNISEFGTSRIDGLSLIDNALNLKIPTIYDEYKEDGQTKRILNQTETFAAREKQQRIKQRFTGWIFADPDRAERLVRLYNDGFNNLRLQEFDGSHLTFPGMTKAITLNPHQKAAVWRIMSDGNTLLAHVVGSGKAQPHDAKVLTPSGWASMGDLMVGDDVIAGDGTVTQVTGVFPQGEKDIYRVTCSDGSSTECCEEHLWLTQTYAERSSTSSAERMGKTWACAAPKVRNTAEIAGTLKAKHLNAKNHSIPLVGMVQFPSRSVPLDPYTLGALLGDGCFRGTGVSFTNPDDQIISEMTLPDNVRVVRDADANKCATYHFRMIKQSGFGADKEANPMVEAIRSLGLMGAYSGSKFVPEVYKLNDATTRLAILQGLLDTDGSSEKRGLSVRFYTVSDRLAEDVIFLVNSLGGTVRRTLKPAPKYTHNGETRTGQSCHVLTIAMPPDVQPFRLSRKVAIPKTKYIPRRYIVSVEPVGRKEARCISVAHPSHLYVTDNFIVTHNTYIMATAAMKLKQAGLIRKSLIATPNHMLEQVGREFLHLYPNARLLIAGKEDLAKDRRKLLTAKIATGEWDAIILTHSSFERTGMSMGFQKAFIREQIAEYTALLIEAAQEADKSRAHRNMIKTIEKRKAAFETKLAELLADKKKDDGLVFDDLGVDQVFIDEFHNFKNLTCATKMDRVAGIQTEGSQKAFDVFMKARYLDQKTPGRGLVGATGTPISNTMVEMYTMQRYLAPALLEERGIAHFDGWAASFGEVVHTMEISPDGQSLRPNARFGKFVNLPELQQMFRSFSDVQTADMLKLPTPALKGGKAQVISVPMSETQREIQAKLVERYERIKRGGVDPRIDNALAITTDGRKLALDARLVIPTAAEDDSKINAMLERAVAIWHRTAPSKGTQMIFCDIGVNPTKWGFCVYDEIKAGLQARGIPAEQIADIGDANTDGKKAALFERVRAGSVRFLIGSTAKMGTGTNVQKRLYAMHHLDAPWKPAEIEQRDGRILRQGNTNEEVEIFRYVTEGSFDAYMWQALQNKARFIAQIMKGDIGVRRASDIGGQELSFAEVKAIASGNPAVLTLAEIDADLQRLTLLKRSHADDQYRSRQQVKYLPDEIARHTGKAERLDAEFARVGTIGEKARERAVEGFNTTLKGVMMKPGSHPLGAYRGLSLTVEAGGDEEPELVAGIHRIAFRHPIAGTLLNRLDSLIAKMPADAANERERARLKATQLEGFQGRIGQAFDQEHKLTRFGEIRTALEALLSGTGDRSGIGILVAEYQSLKDAAPEPKAEVLLPVVADTKPSPVREPTQLVEAWTKPKSAFIPKRAVAKPVQLGFQF